MRMWRITNIVFLKTLYEFIVHCKVSFIGGAWKSILHVSCWRVGNVMFVAWPFLLLDGVRNACR